MDVLMKYRAGRLFAPGADVRFWSVVGATEIRFIAWDTAPKTPAATGKGKLGAAIRHPQLVAPCMPREAVVTVRGWHA
ncbi:hypothetical protein [uncultured Rhodoblastus sp.]|jgi:hypothetical protein|uniref:hypothetical protein n=1 Tax=uncultured Rhodoblastus sp. TaxID=543037 RepID=UPI0025EB0D90|nr:hypothetical protein [uncultured Rhodoblastus sp.]